MMAGLKKEESKGIFTLFEHQKYVRGIKEQGAIGDILGSSSAGVGDAGSKTTYFNTSSFRTSAQTLSMRLIAIYLYVFIR